MESRFIGGLSPESTSQQMGVCCRVAKQAISFSVLLSFPCSDDGVTQPAAGPTRAPRACGAPQAARRCCVRGEQIANPSGLLCLNKASTPANLFHYRPGAELSISSLHQNRAALDMVSIWMRYEPGVLAGREKSGLT